MSNKIPCPECEGKGFMEYSHGLLRVQCEPCKGAGEVEGDSVPTVPAVEDALLTTEACGQVFAKITTALENLTKLAFLCDEAEAEVRRCLTGVVKIELDGEKVAETVAKGIADDSDSGTEPANQPAGSANTGKSRKRKKQTAKRQARKKAG